MDRLIRVLMSPFIHYLELWGHVSFSLLFILGEGGNLSQIPSQHLFLTKFKDSLGVPCPW